MGPMRRLAFLLAIAAALLAPATATGAEPTVSVQATVERQVPNDAARVHFTVSKERRGRAAALRIVAVRLRAVIAAAQSTPGVGPGDITTGSISVRRVERGKHPVYRASESVTVITHDPTAAGDLVAAGATSTRGPNFFVGDREAAYNAALVEAFTKAKTKAEILATAAGATLGPALTIAESGSVVPVFEPVNAEEPVSDKAYSPPTKPGRSTVKATVAVTFALH